MVSFTGFFYLGIESEKQLLFFTKWKSYYYRYIESFSVQAVTSHYVFFFLFYFVLWNWQLEFYYTTQ